MSTHLRYAPLSFGLFFALILYSPSSAIAQAQSDSSSEVQQDDVARPCLLLPVGVSWNCFIALRTDAALARLNQSLPAPAVPGQTLVLDLNLTGKQEIFSGTRFSLDADFVAKRSWNFKQRNILTGTTETTTSGGGDNPSYRLGLNEAFIASEWVPEFQFAVGKKRVLWGSGFASNPTDVLNPGKNVLDPTLERRGAWLLLLEYLREKDALSFFIAPGVVEDKNTLPEKMFRYASPSGKEEFNHYLAGARFYQLLGGADVNLMVFRGNRYRDDMVASWKFGASWSQILTSISKQLEGHSEVRFQQGSSRADPLMRSRLNDKSWHMSLLLGGRYDFDNESALVVEFFRQTDGDSRGDLKTRVEYGLSLLRTAALISARRGLGSQGSLPALPPAAENNSSASQGETTRAVGQLGMQNYLFINWQRYKINEDLFLSWSAAHNLHDAGGFQGPSLQWTPTQSTSLTLSANSDYSLLPDAGVVVESIGRVQEIELNPVRARVGLELKAFF
jgi:hypothetical protein